MDISPMAILLAIGFLRHSTSIRRFIFAFASASSLGGLLRFGALFPPPFARELLAFILFS
jgi:hypothetical protein